MKRALASVMLLAGWNACAQGIPVMAWIGPPASETTSTRYEELAAAGFTHSMSWFRDTDSMAEALDVADGAGVKLLINCPELGQEPEETARRFRNHPAIGGYYLRDEPGADLFDELAVWLERIQSVDDEHPCYINLYPNYADEEQLAVPSYEEYVRQFVTNVPVQIISFDHYPVVKEGDELRLRDGYYPNLQLIADTAREVGKPFWAFALSVAHAPYPVAEVRHLRLQVFSNLAYGAQGIQYFTYWTPVSDRWDFHTAPIGVDGNKTEVYDRVAQVNGEIGAFSDVFVGATVLQVGHLGENVREDVRVFEVEAPIEDAFTGGQHALLSRFRKGDTHYLAVVNPKLDSSLSIDLNLNTVSFGLNKDGTRERFGRGAVGLVIAPGDMFLLGWAMDPAVNRP